MDRLCSLYLKRLGHTFFFYSYCCFFFLLFLKKKKNNKKTRSVWRFASMTQKERCRFVIVPYPSPPPPPFFSSIIDSFDWFIIRPVPDEKQQQQKQPHTHTDTQTKMASLREREKNNDHIDRAWKLLLSRTDGRTDAEVRHSIKRWFIAHSAVRLGLCMCLCLCLGSLNVFSIFFFIE